MPLRLQKWKSAEIRYKKVFATCYVSLPTQHVAVAESHVGKPTSRTDAPKQPTGASTDESAVHYIYN